VSPIITTDPVRTAVRVGEQPETETPPTVGAFAVFVPYPPPGLVIVIKSDPVAVE
jgi:hypothetical protein